MDLRRAPSLQPQASSLVRHLQGREGRPDHARRGAAQRPRRLPGRSARRIYLTAHYDTVNIGGTGQIGSNTRPSGQPAADPQLRADQDYDVDAPGANDNGSGTALTIELARVLATSGLEFDATIVFALWAGEEQGLVGSRAHAQRLAAERPSSRPTSTTTSSATLTAATALSIANPCVCIRKGQRTHRRGRWRATSRRVAALYVPSHRIRLMARPDRFSRGSDHSSFNDAATRRSPSARPTRTSRSSIRRCDTVDGVDVAYLAQNARVNVAEPCGARAGAAGTGRDQRAGTGRRSDGSLRATTPTCSGMRRRAPLPIESTGARPGRTTGATRAWSATRLSSRCRASRSTTTSLAWLQSAPTATRASSAPTWSDGSQGPDVKLLP